MPPKNPFAMILEKMLERRGALAELARNSGVSSSNISRMASGDYTPGPEILAQLVQPMSENDRNALVVEYLLLHHPKNAPAVRVIVTGEKNNEDRLERAIRMLDAQTRESLATIIEAVNRSPERGRVAIQAMSGIFEGANSMFGLAAERPGNPPVELQRREVRYKKPGRKD